MSLDYRRYRFAFAVLLLMTGSPVLAQRVTVGVLGPPLGIFGPGPLTLIDITQGARGEGTVTSATFHWWDAPCPGAVKIKFWHFGGFGHNFSATYSEERGPFDVHQLIETVSLVPPVTIKRNDEIGITALTNCGGPVSGSPLDSSWLEPGDFRGDFGGITFSGFDQPHVLVEATNDSVGLLGGRFRVTLVATNPRDGRIATGRGVAQGDRFGYFSLPEFTGDSDFPEVIVKMADATTSPPPFGGSFWFFYSSLTDVEYVLTVLDQVTGITRTYTSPSSAPGQLCGGADTDAFRP